MALTNSLKFPSVLIGRVLSSSSLDRRSLHLSNQLRHDEYDNKLWYDPGESAERRTWETLKVDFRRVRRRYLEAKYDAYRRKGILTHPMRDVMQYELLPYRTTFCIIGGGIVGSSIAYWIKQRARSEEIQVTVIERDDTFAQSATVLSAGGIRQQFSIPESVQMSLFSAEFLRNAGSHLQILDNDPPDIQFTPMGYLFLANNEAQAEKLEKDHKMQLDQGAKVKLLNKDELKLKFPFMNVDDILVGSFGLENEGWFDPWSLLSALREKNLTIGVHYIKAKVAGFISNWVNDFDPRGVFPESDHWKYRRLDGVMIEPQKTDAAPRPLRFMVCINAAGPWAGQIARMAGIGTGEDLMSVPIPIEPRKRYVYVFHCPNGPGLDMPFLIDPSGVWCRREGISHNYICGKSPTEEEDAKIDHSNLDVDHDFFNEQVWPVLAKRIPSFEGLKVKNSWAGYYDYNTFDQNAIIGPHLFYENFFQCAGFSGHGIQHALAAGRGVMEKFHDGAYVTVNLRCFDMRRILKNNRLEEAGII